MATGLTFRDGTPAQMMRGKYQTRNQRVAEITGHHIESGETNGRPWTQKIWDGNLLMSDCRTVDTRATWSDDGHYLHQEGVQSPFDLCLVVIQEPDPQPAAPPTLEPVVETEVAPADPIILENQLAYAALCQALAPYMIEGETGSTAIVRIVSERDLAQDRDRANTELLSHIREVLVPQLRHAEPASVGIARIISERDHAIAERDAALEQVKVLSKPKE
jgi:hypothetical protein